MLKLLRQNPRMAISFFVFVCLLVLPLFLAFGSKDKATQQTQNLPLIELVNFKFLQMDTNGTDKVVLGALGYHFKDFDKIVNFKFSQKDGAKLESFSAKNAQKSGDFVYFDGDIVCKNAKGDRVTADKASYDTAKKSLHIDSKFQINSQSYLVTGENMRVWDENKKLSAERVKAKIFTDK